MRMHLHRVALIGLLLATALATATAEEYVWKDGKWVAAAQPVPGTVGGELAIVRRHVAAGQLDEALEAVEGFLSKYPDDPGCEEAILLAGQAELDAERYWQAYEQFEKMLDRYPNGRFLERALTREMDVANAFLAGKKRIVAKIFRLPARDEGLDILRRITEHAPGSLIAEKAMLRTGEYHFDRSEFVESAEAYDEYLQLFPKGRSVPHAMLQGARATFASFKGVAYDETPLVEADQRYKMLIDQYPAVAQKAKASQVIRQIVDIRAERAYDTARFYDRTGRKKPAAFYYRQVVEQFPDSPWAREAEAALAGRETTRPPAPAVKAPPQPADVKAPAPRPAPAPTPEAKPQPQPKTSPAPKPEDLEDLANPRRKGRNK